MAMLDLLRRLWAWLGRWVGMTDVLVLDDPNNPGHQGFVPPNLQWVDGNDVIRASLTWNDSEGAAIQVNDVDGLPIASINLSIAGAITMSGVFAGGRAGTVSAGTDGSLSLQSGSSSIVLAADNSIVLNTADSGIEVTLGADGFAVNGFAVVLLGLPDADPEVEGQLYTDGAPSAGTPQPLMVSGGPP